MRAYIAGPMQGQPGHGHPNFEDACVLLRVNFPRDEFVSPHEIDFGETEETRGQMDHHHYMREDLKALLTCDTIILLPGWSKSKGSMIELNTAVGAGLKVFLYLHGVLLDPTHRNYSYTYNDFITVNVPEGLG